MENETKTSEARIDHLVRIATWPGRKTVAQGAEGCRNVGSDCSTGNVGAARQIGQLVRIARRACCRGGPDGSENRVKSVIWWGLQGGDCAVLVVSGTCGLRGGVLVVGCRGPAWSGHTCTPQGNAVHPNYSITTPPLLHYSTTDGTQIRILAFTVSALVESVSTVPLSLIHI